MNGRWPSVLVLGALIPASVAAPGPAAAAPARDWHALATKMAAPWAALQRRDGTFSDYVVANDPHGKPRDPYGRSFLGLALLQTGLRDNDEPQISAGLRSIGIAAAHPVPRDRIVFENLALTTAYNIARTHLKQDPRFATIRPALENRLRHITPVQFGGSRPYYNYYLVDSAALMELLTSPLTSTVRGSALANRRRTRALVSNLVNNQLPQIAARYTTNDPAGRLSLLSDPPWNPPAYDAFSLALLAQVVNLLGPDAGPRPRELMRRMARSLWTLASPQGSVSYYGRSQDESWTLAMTAYGALATADLPGTSRKDASRSEALADAALTRLRDRYASVRYGFLIVPALAGGIRSGIAGLDLYADAASYSGLTLVGLNWALDEMDATGPAPGPLAASTPGVHRISAGDSAIVLVRTPQLWFAVKQGPGTLVRGVGDYSQDIRYDSGLVALQSTPTDGAPFDVIPTRPHSRRGDDRAEPVLVRGAVAARFWGTSLRASPNGNVTLNGGFRAGARWLRGGVAIRYDPSPCGGVRMTIPTRRGDRIDQALWIRSNGFARSSHGRILADRAEQITLNVRPRATSMRRGYASGAEQRLTRVRMRFAGTGARLTFTFCPRNNG